MHGRMLSRAAALGLALAAGCTQVGGHPGPTKIPVAIPSVFSQPGGQPQGSAALTAGSVQGTEVSTLAGGLLTSIRYPKGVVLETSGRAIVSDTYGHRILAISPGGDVTNLAGTGMAGHIDGPGGTAQFNFPFGVAIASDGAVLVADTGNYTIRKIAADGTVSTLAGRAGIQATSDGAALDSRFRGPSGIALDASGSLYIADRIGNTIRKLTAGGQVSTVAGAGQAGFGEGGGTTAILDGPSGVAVHPTSGVVYIADTNNHRIRALAPDGTVSTFAGSGVEGFEEGDAAIAKFAFPRGVAVDGAGNVLVADAGNHRIRKITPAGMVTTFAGSGHPGSTGGARLEAKFNEPYGLVVSASGRVLIADYSNHRIREVK